MFWGAQGPIGEPTTSILQKKKKKTKHSTELLYKYILKKKRKNMHY